MLPFRNNRKDRYRVLNPLDHTRVVAQGNDSIMSSCELPRIGFLVPLKHAVCDPQKLHDSLVQVKVLETFEKIGVSLAVRSQESKLLWLGFCWDDDDLLLKGVNGDSCSLLGARDFDQ